MRALLMVFRATGDRRFLEPIPRAIAYLRKSRLPDDRLARFYELETNRPLYFTKDYQLTYDDGDMPTHYSFKTGSGLDAIEREYERLAAMDAEELAKLRDDKARRSEVVPTKASSQPTKRQAQAARDAIAALDDRGRWVEPGKLTRHDDAEVKRIIRTSTFIRQVRALAAYLAACGR
jgi:hypothetical protein